MTDPERRRVGDRERLAVQDRLRDAYAQGALTTDEFEERLSVALSAVWTTDLAPLVADLPEPRDGSAGATWPSPRTPSVPAPPTGRPPQPDGEGRVRAPRRGVAGPIVGGLVVVAAVLGVTTLDLGEVAIFGSTQVQADPGEAVRVLTLFGSTEIVVPDGVAAEPDILAVFGSSDCGDACRVDGDPADAVEIDGIALFGSIEVVTRAEADGG